MAGLEAPGARGFTELGRRPFTFAGGGTIRAADTT